MKPETGIKGGDIGRLIRQSNERPNREGETDMKKRMVLLTALVILVTALCGFAQADGAWVCPKCGGTWPQEYQFCPNDRMEQPAAVQYRSGGTPWPVRSFTGSGTAINSAGIGSEGRRQSYFGPGRSYAGGGAYKPREMQGGRALFAEGDYVLVDFSGGSFGKCCVYFEARSLTNSNVQQEMLTGYSAVTTASVQPRMGPGNEYHIVDNTWKDRVRNVWVRTPVKLSYGTNIEVFFETNGWVFAEFQSEIGTARAWIPVKDVESC